MKCWTGWSTGGIKIAGRNSNNLRYTDDTIIMTESEEELKSLLMKVKEESKKVGLELKIQKTKIMASGPVTSWQIDGETMETVRDFIFLGSKITADGDCSHEIKRCLLLGRKVMTNLSDQISHSVVSNSLRPHESQHARPPCPSPTPGVHSVSCPSSRWCHPAISSSVVPFSSCPQSLPASESFPVSQLFAWGGHSTGVSAWASLLPKKHPGLISFRMDWLDILAVQGTLKSLLQHHSSKVSILWHSAFFIVQLSCPYKTTRTTIVLNR